jgi:ribosomal protein L40E
MAPLTDNYPYTDDTNELQTNLGSAFGFAFQGNKAFEQSEAVKTISNWYKDIKEHKAERQEDGDNKHAILSLISNKTITELVKHVEPYYKDTIIQNIGIDTHFIQDGSKMNCNIDFISIKPNVKFVKKVNEEETASATFRFQLDSSIHIKKLQIHTNSLTTAGKSIDIEKLGVKLELKLLQATISSMQMSMPITCLKKPVKLLSREFEIKNVSFHLRRSSNDKKEIGVLNSLGSFTQQKSQISIICQRCGARNQSSFNFCNICGSSIQSSCQTCGNTNPPGAAFCVDCGSGLR